MRVKGLRDIKTLKDIPNVSRKGGLRIQRCPPVGALNASTKPIAAKSTPRAWVFSPEPNFRRYQKTLLIDKFQEPNTEVFAETESALVIAEMPDVRRKEDIRLSAEHDILILEAAIDTKWGKRKFAKELLIPFPIDLENTQISINNGIIEMTLFPIKESQAGNLGADT